MYNELSSQRIRSIDVFRGITILVMIFVNDVAGVSGIPEWMKHKPAGADAMTFVDVVFPAFLFIVGMSLPFAINNRMNKTGSFGKTQLHILWRTLGLLTLGVFMVNAEGGHDAGTMPVPKAVWALLFYLAAILVWNIYTFRDKRWQYLLQSIGAAGLLLLALVYRGGADGTEGLKPRWWGILGLIGWAYFFSAIIYQLVRGKMLLLLFAIAGCITWYTVSRADFSAGSRILQWMSARAGHAAHTSIVLSGLVLSLIFFEKKENLSISRRFFNAVAFALAVGTAGFLLRPYYPISKIHASPTWCLYSVGICILLYALLYWIVDLQGKKKWTDFFQPAASNPLLVYILPGIILYLQLAIGLYFIPATLRQGIPGIAWSACFALGIMWLAAGLNKLKIRLHL